MKCNRCWSVTIIQRRLRVGFLESKKIFDAFNQELTNPCDDCADSLAALQGEALALRASLKAVYHELKAFRESGDGGFFDASEAELFARRTLEND